MSEIRKTTFQFDEKSSSEINKIYSVIIPIELFKKWSDTQIMPGFRTGKIPLRLLKKDEFLKEILSDLLKEIQKEANIDVVFASNYVVKKFEYESDIELTLSVEKIPMIPKMNFENILVKTFDVNITEENIQKGILNYSTFHSKAGDSILKNSKNGDFVALDIEIQDLKSNEIQSNKQEIRLGSNTFIPLIEQALVDKEIGYIFTHNVNEDIQIKLTITDIKSAKPLSINEVKEKLNVIDQTLEDFFKDKLTLESKETSNSLILETIKKAILDSKFEIPLSSIQREFQKVWDQTLTNLNYVKELDLEEFIKNKLNISMQEFESNITNIAAAQAKIRFMYYTIAKDENIKIQESEINEALQSQIKFFNNNLEQTKKFYEENEDSKEEMLENILFTKISSILINRVQKTKRETLSLDELHNINVERLEYTISNSEGNDEKIVIENIKDNKKKSVKKLTDDQNKS